MEAVNVSYANNKSGTYVEFRLKIYTRSLEELNAYDKFLQKSIKQDFKTLFDDYGMDFSTEASYIVSEGEDMYMVMCLCGETTPELERKLSEIGVMRRDG